MDEQNINRIVEKSKNYRYLLIAGIVVLFVVVGYGSYWLGKNASPKPNVNNVMVAETTLATNSIESPVQPAAVTPTMNGRDPAGSEDSLVWAESKTVYPDAVWHKPVLIPNLNLFKGQARANYGLDDMATYEPYDDGEKYFSVGTTNYGGEKSDVIFATGGNSGMFSGGIDYAFFAKTKSGFILLNKNSIVNAVEFPTSTPEYTSNLVKPYLVDNNFVFNSLLSFPKKIFGNSRQVLTFNQVISFTEATRVLPKAVAELDPVGKIFARGPLNGLVVGIGPLVGVYEEKVDFVDSKSVPQVVWNDGSKNSNVYNYVGQGGCGVSNLLSLVEDSSKVTMTDLIPVGKNVKGDVVYELNHDHPYLKEKYDNYYYEASGEKKPWEDFVALKPLIYWVDPFGQLVEMQISSIVPQAECGKPVIYLYPEKTTKIDVKVEPKGGLSFTEPSYNGLWKVKAEPNGKLTNLGDGKTYPYLFWEGRGGIYTSPTKGFVVKQTEVDSFLSDKLSAFGFNGKEIADFKEFWLPRMQGSPYYFVGFLGKREMDAIAPLTISPKPDTVIRILMDFKPLQKSIEVEGYAIHTPERKGFTVVEWGGVLR